MPFKIKHGNNQSTWLHLLYHFVGTAWLLNVSHARQREQKALAVLWITSVQHVHNLCGGSCVWAMLDLSGSHQAPLDLWQGGRVREEMKEAEASSPSWPPPLYIVTHNDLSGPACNLHVYQRGPALHILNTSQSLVLRRNYKTCRGAFRWTGWEEWACCLSQWTFPLSVWHMTK